MNFYDRKILPWLLDFAMRNREVARFRARIVPLARGTALEVGIGSGLNLPFYAAQVERIVGVDPSHELLQMARERARGMPMPVELVSHTGEALPLPDACVDAVVFTFALCTIPDPLSSLREARRVLRPAGELLFSEHGLAPDEGVRRWQRRLNPVWRRIAGGCNLDRRIDALIESAGFRFTGLTAEYAKGPRPMSYVYTGRASPA